MLRIELSSFTLEMKVRTTFCSATKQRLPLFHVSVISVCLLSMSDSAMSRLPICRSARTELFVLLTGTKETDINRFLRVITQMLSGVQQIK